MKSKNQSISMWPSKLFQKLYLEKRSHGMNFMINQRSAKSVRKKGVQNQLKTVGYYFNLF